MSEQIVGVLIGGGLALLGGLVVAITSEVRGRGEWRRQARLSAAIKAIGALQLLNREITNLAISRITTIDGTGPEWDAFHAATVAWNTARHEAALMCPAAELTLLDGLDRELDHVLEVAISKQWDASEFRIERANLGAMASQYVRLARQTANEGKTDLPSLWSWSDDLDEASRQPGTALPGGAPNAGPRAT